MSAGRTKLNRKQEAAIASLLTERTQAAAATKAGISEATLQRWLNLPGFQTAYRQARRQSVESAVGHLQRAASKAAKRLEELIDSADAKIAVRASLGVVDRAIQAVELTDLQQQIDELQQAIKDLTDRKAFS